MWVLQPHSGWNTSEKWTGQPWSATRTKIRDNFFKTGNRSTGSPEEKYFPRYKTKTNYGMCGSAWENLKNFAISTAYPLAIFRFLFLLCTQEEKYSNRKPNAPWVFWITWDRKANEIFDEPENIRFEAFPAGPDPAQASSGTGTPGFFFTIFLHWFHCTDCSSQRIPCILGIKQYRIREIKHSTYFSKTFIQLSFRPESPEVCFISGRLIQAF